VTIEKDMGEDEDEEKDEEKDNIKRIIYAKRSKKKDNIEKKLSETKVIVRKVRKIETIKITYRLG
jgi:hypothetical protein